MPAKRKQANIQCIICRKLVTTVQKSIENHKLNYKYVASSICQVLPLECAQSLFLNLNEVGDFAILLAVSVS